MISPTITFPTTNILEWYDSTSITISGYVDPDSVVVEVNGSSVGVVFNLMDYSWSYSVTLSGYNNYIFTIISKDSLSQESPETDFDLTIREPFLTQTLYSNLITDLVGKTNAVSSIVEASTGSVSGFTSVNISYIPHTNNFLYQNYTFTASTSDFYFRAIDDYTSYSAVGHEILQYQLEAPLIYSMTLPVTSLTIGVSGEASVEASGFVFSPSGGVFASGYTGSGIQWGYEFTLLRDTTQFEVTAIDVFGGESDPSILTIPYALPAPEITEPTYTASSNLVHTFKGTSNPNTKGIVYSTFDTFNSVQIISASAEPYIINPSNDKLFFRINNETRFITLASGVLTAQDVVDTINSYYYKEVALVNNNRVAIIGNNILVEPASGNSTFGFVEREYNISISFNCPDTVDFIGKNTLDLNIDGIDYSIFFDRGITYTRQDIANKINESIGSLVAFDGSLIFSAASNIFIKKANLDLNIPEPYYMGIVTPIDGLWEFNFNTYDPFTQVFVTALDELYNYTPSVSKTIDYNIISPIILTPGTPRVLTDNEATLGSTTYFFVTVSGNFNLDGVIPGDYVLGLTGTNLGEVRQVLAVEDYYLETEDFLVAWAIGDKIAVYPKEDRPTYNSNQFTMNCTGKCDSNSLKILYTDSTFLDEVLVYAKNSELYDFAPTSNELNLEIDGEVSSITFPSVSGMLAVEAVNLINSFFSKPVAVNYDTKFYLTGRHLKIKGASANSIFGFSVGDYYLISKLNVSFPISIHESDLKTFHINVDDREVNFVLNTGIYTKNDILDKINFSAGAEVAFEAPYGINLLGNKFIQNYSNLPVLNFLPQTLGVANYVTGVPDWNTTFSIVLGNFELFVGALDLFYNLISGAALPISYKIEPPTLFTTQLIVTIDSIDLNGSYPIAGADVQLDGVNLNASSGLWATTLSALNVGETVVELVTIDAFGNTSDILRVTITYNDPNYPAVEVPPIVSTLSWKSLHSPNLLPSPLKFILETVKDFITPLISVLKFVQGILRTVRVFLFDPKNSLLSLLRRAIQSLINKVLQGLLDFINGLGVFILSTLPEFSAFMKGDLDFLDNFDGGFEGFKIKVIDSLYDENDSARPQFSDRVSIGAVVLVIDSEGDIANLINACKDLYRLVRQGLMVWGLEAPRNVKAVSQKGRIILTWDRPEGLKSYKYVIYRRSDIKPKTVDSKTLIDSPGTDATTKVPDKDIASREPKYNWHIVGIIEDKTIISKDFAVFRKFKYIDGPELSPAEVQEGNWVEKIASGTANYLDALNENVNYTVGCSNNRDLVAGTTYYYKIVPYTPGTLLNTDLNKNPGDSVEVRATVLNDIRLTKITRDFSDELQSRISNKQYISLNTYQVNGQIYNGDSKYITNDPKDILLVIDGVEKQALKVIGKDNIVQVKKEDISIKTKTLKVTYWGIPDENLNRASLRSKFKEPFNYNETNNVLKLRVGLGAKVPQFITSESINYTQSVTFDCSRTIPGQNKKYSPLNMKATDIAKQIREQTYGIRVIVDNYGYIILEDDLNPNIYKKSHIDIVENPNFLQFGDSDGLPSSTSTNVSSIPPDWYSIKLADLFPMLNDLNRYVNNTFNHLFDSVKTLIKSLEDYIIVLEKKLQRMIDLLKEIQKKIQDIEDALTLKFSLYMLFIPYNTGGLTYFTKSLMTATGGPTNSDYAAGVVLLAGDGATFNILDLIFGSL